MLSLTITNPGVSVDASDSILVVYHADSSFEENHGRLKFQLFRKSSLDNVERNMTVSGEFHALVDHDTDGENRRVAISQALQIASEDGGNPTIVVRVTVPTGTTGSVQNQFLQVIIFKGLHLIESERLIVPTPHKPGYGGKK